MTEDPANTNSWHLDRRVSITQIVSILVVAIGLLSWVSSLDGKIKQNTASIEKLTHLVEAHSTLDSHPGAQLFQERWEERYTHISTTISELKDNQKTQTDRLIDLLDKMDKRIQRQWDTFNAGKLPSER